MPNKLLLDTCALLWLASGNKKLSPQQLESIDAADSVYVSAITGFEVALKHAKGKLVLPKEPKQWFFEVLDFNHIEVLPLNLDICIAATQLAFHHNDPCDRFIIATAMRYDLPVITADSIFQQYGASVLS